jgi:2-C-methyl-D-erythritol 4-phosphate cytidylyltransferase / 2-C-methyl-D-erythritol 2,4-cyclodiphosphate synthase
MRVRTGVVIPAAGSGTRMESSTPKQFLELGGKPLLVHSISAFAGCDFIAQVVVAVSEEHYDTALQMLSHHLPGNPKLVVITGGRRRQDSVKNGIGALDTTIEVVLVHDGARPLVTRGLIERCYREILEHGAAIAAVPVKDTLKRTDADLQVSATVDRDTLWQAQTPQGARKELLEKAYGHIGEADVTDESMLLEKAGIPVRLVTGEETNFKITRKEDLVLAESIIATRKGSIRIGHGFDAHRFVDGRPLILGGIEIDHQRGLAGHSDADVVCHALCDAILGTLGEGDIGSHFPDNDPAYEGISSLILLDKVTELRASLGMKLTSADITIVCQAPKLASYIDAMKGQLAHHCRVGTGLVNIKATTTEKMGYVGREEGISCHAVVLVEHS